MKIEKKFWKNKKVLITGHTGFKGGWLSVILNLLGSKVSDLHLKKSVNESEVLSPINKYNISEYYL